MIFWGSTLFTTNVRLGSFWLLRFQWIVTRNFPKTLLCVIQESEISPYLIMEPADRQVAANLPIYVNRADFSPYEGNTLCGFGEIGSTDTNYKHCLVRVVLRPEYRDLFELVKCEMTVQVKIGWTIIKWKRASLVRFENFDLKQY